jgi:hypothetical protein
LSACHRNDEPGHRETAAFRDPVGSHGGGVNARLIDLIVVRPTLRGRGIPGSDVKVVARIGRR